MNIKHLLITSLTLLFFALPASAQRGAGQNMGLAQQGYQADMVTLSGRVKAINTGPCAQTTGPSLLGTHLLIENDQGELDIHLGPSDFVDPLIEHIQVGDRISVEAFQTPALDASAYIARAVTEDGRTVTLRDDTLRPVWAGQARGAAWGGRGYRRSDRGRGPGAGYGMSGGGGRRVTPPNGTGTTSN